MSIPLSGVWPLTVEEKPSGRTSSFGVAVFAEGLSPITDKRGVGSGSRLGKWKHSRPSRQIDLELVVSSSHTVSLVSGHQHKKVKVGFEHFYEGAEVDRPS